MRKINLLKIIVLLFSTLSANSQEVKIGERIPDDVFTNFISKSGSTLKNKYIILDFWSISCSSCIRDFPHLDSIQKQYDTVLQIIAITNDNIAELDRFRSHNKIISGTSIPIVANGEKLSKHFRHLIIPHLIWISPERKVIAITHAEYLTADNIIDVVKGRHSMPEKRDIFLNVHKPLFSVPAALSNYPVYYSSFLPHVKGLSPAAGIQIDSIKSTVRVYAYNTGILSLLATTLSPEDTDMSMPVFYKQISLQVKDSARYIFCPRYKYLAAWEQENTFCYDGVFPITMPIKSIKTKIRNDLNAYLNIDAQIKKETMKCIVLYVGKTPIQRSEQEKPSIKISKDAGHQFAKNISVTTFIRQLNVIDEVPPVLDRTGISYNIDVDLGMLDVSNIPILISRLEKAGFTVKLEDFDINKLTIKD